jgi:dihydroorotase
MSQRVFIHGGRVVDPSQDFDGPADVIVEDGCIAALGPGLDAPEDAERIDATGLVVAPGFIDLHVHLREPGGEHKETIATGARAAVAGGFTTVWAMPNTDPPIDDPAAVGFVVAAGEAAGGARVMPIGAATIGMKGEHMTEVGELVAAGAVAVSDDGVPVRNSALMRRLLEYTQTFGIAVVQHSEDVELAAGGVMNEGAVATALGLRGIPNCAEAAMVARDAMLVELTGGHLHVCHVSARETVEQLRLARDKGLSVTSEVTPHHLILTEELVRGYNTEAKVNPPLRTEADVEAVRQALIDGVIDVIATDHAPHHYEEKEREFDDAPFGINGLETAFGLSMKALVEPGHLTLSGLVDRMSCRPAAIMSLDTGTLRTRAPADVVLLAPDESWIVEPRNFASRSWNTPIGGWSLPGRVRRTLVGGATRFELDASE